MLTIYYHIHTSQNEYLWTCSKSYDTHTNFQQTPYSAKWIKKKKNIYVTRPLTVIHCCHRFLPTKVQTGLWPELQKEACSFRQSILSVFRNGTSRWTNENSERQLNFLQSWSHPFAHGMTLFSQKIVYPVMDQSSYCLHSLMNPVARI